MNASAIRFLVVLSLLATPFVASSCGPADQDEVAAMPTETEAPSPTEPPSPTATPKPTSTRVPPTATPTPAPTDTPEPPTPTPPPPTPTETVTGAQVYRNIDYAESGDRKRMLTIYTPNEVDPPYTTLLILPAVQSWATAYEPLVQELIGLGYAVVSADIRQVIAGDTWSGTPGTVDAFCAYAWLAQNGAEYHLDTERLVVFGHFTSAGHAATLGVADEEAYALFMTECPHPIPETGRIAGVVTFGGRFFTPEGTLTDFGQPYSLYFSKFYNVSEEDWRDKVDALKEVPPQEWRGGGALDEAAAQLAQYLPLYWVQGPKGAQPSPPFLLVHAGKEYGDYPVLALVSSHDSKIMAEKLEAMGVTVSSQTLSTAAYHDITKEGHSSIARLADAIDAFMKELSE